MVAAASTDNNKDLSKGGPQIASSGAPIKEGHATKRKDKDGNEIRLDELANFNPDTFLDSHRTFLKRLHVASLTCMIVSAVMLLLAIAICITFVILTGSEMKRIEEIQIKEKESTQKITDWKVASCQTCYKSSDDERITTNMTGNLGNDSKVVETAPCEYSITEFWKCDECSSDDNSNNSSSKYYCFKN